MFIIRFLLFAILFLFVAAIVGLVFFLSSIKNIKRQFDNMRGNMGGGQQQGRTSGWQNGSAGSGSQQSVSDSRSNEERNKRIFAENEGEYVDFEETE